MARWRVTEKHYLNVPGTEYEYRETNETTGKQARKVFPVPLYLDPANPSDCNYPGEIIVTHKADKAYPRDLIFVGPPTMGMAPLDEEAEAISAKMEKNWVSAFTTIEEGFNGKMIVEIADALQSIKATSQPSSQTDQSTEIAGLKAQIAALTTLVEASNAERVESRQARR